MFRTIIQVLSVSSMNLQVTSTSFGLARTLSSAIRKLQYLLSSIASTTLSRDLPRAKSEKIEVGRRRRTKPQERIILQTV